LRQGQNKMALQKAFEEDGLPSGMRVRAADAAVRPDRARRGARQPAGGDTQDEHGINRNYLLAVLGWAFRSSTAS